MLFAPTEGLYATMLHIIVPHHLRFSQNEKVLKKEKQVSARVTKAKTNFQSLKREKEGLKFTKKMTIFLSF